MKIFIIKSKRLQAHLLQSFRLLILLACMCLVLPFAVLAQTATPATLPPAAQEALNNGILAAKLPDYLLAIRYFEEARKTAPKHPVIYLNLGLAESKISGRELRAIAWFGAYLVAYPGAPNAAAVKEQIAVLKVRNQSNISRFLKTVQDAAGQSSSFNEPSRGGTTQADLYLYELTTWWLDSGDMAAAIKSANLVRDADLKGSVQGRIAIAKAEAGDIAGAQKTADLIQDARSRSLGLIGIAKAKIKGGDFAGAKNTLASALKAVDLIETDSEFRKTGLAIRTEWLQSQHRTLIAAAQAEAGDIAGAQKTTDLILAQHVYFKSGAQITIAEAQLNARDIAGAEKTLADAQKNAELIDDASWKTSRQKAIVESQARLGIAKGASPNRQSTSDTQPTIPPVVTVSDWLKKLDDDNMNNDCPLSTEPFLDLAGYLKSLPPNNAAPGHSSGVFYYRLHETAKKIISAQNVIHQMLKQEAKK